MTASNWTLERLLDTQQLVRSIVAEVLQASADDVDAAIQGGLAQLGSYLGADRAYTYVLHDGDLMSNIHEWCADGVRAEIQAMQARPTSLIAAWLPGLRTGEAVEIPDVDDLPDSRAEGRELLREQGVRSLLVVPMHSLGELVGFVGFDVVRELRTFHQIEVNLLGALADAVCAVLVHRRMDAESARLQRRLAALSRHSNDLILVMAADGTPIYRSESWQALVVERGKVTWDQIVHPDDQPMCLAATEEVLRCGSGASVVLDDFRVRTDHGEWRWCAGTLANHLADPAVGGIVLNTHDVTDRKRHEEQLAHDALHDPLTGLGNRVLLDDRLRSACDRAAHEGGAVGVLYLDIDGFKLINDSLGHATGDQLLRAFATRLRELVGARDTLARFGGDEFLLLTGDATSPLDLATLAGRMQSALTQPFDVDGQHLRVTVSVGLAIAEGGSASPGRLLADADTAVRRAKRSGRNRVSVFDADMRTEVVRRTRVLQRLQSAVERAEVIPHFQPLVDLRTGHFIGAEALARWTDDELGVVSPGEFIPVAEDTGLIESLTAGIFRRAVREVRRWPPWMYVSVNLSASMVSSLQTAGDLLEMMRDAGVPGQRVCVEVTETAVMADPEAAAVTLDQLRAVGIRTAMDDFGTGYSSLGVLRSLPIDVLKIDHSFVDGVDGDERDRRLVEAVASVAEDFGMTTLAEGIETDAQRNVLLEIGCHAAQGYHFARPMPADEVAALLGGAARRSTGGQAPAAPTGGSG